MSDIDIINQEILEVEAQLTELTDSLASSNFAEATARTASDNYNRQLINNLSLSIPALFDGLRALISSIDTSAFITDTIFDTARTEIDEAIEAAGGKAIYKAFNVTKVDTLGVISYTVDAPGITAEATSTGLDITFNVAQPSYVALVTGEMASTDDAITKAKSPKVISKTSLGFSVTAMLDSTESPETIVAESLQIIITGVG